MTTCSATPSNVPPVMTFSGLPLAAIIQHRRLSAHSAFVCFYSLAFHCSGNKSNSSEGDKGTPSCGSAKSDGDGVAALQPCGEHVAAVMSSLPLRDQFTDLDLAPLLDSVSVTTWVFRRRSARITFPSTPKRHDRLGAYMWLVLRSLSRSLELF